MQKFVIFVFVATVGFCAAAYTQKYSYINLHDVLHNTRLLKRYIDCLLDVPFTCTKDGDYLREVLPGAFKENCAECNATQKENALKVIAYLIKHHQDWWKLIDKKFNADRSVFVTSNMGKIKYYQVHEI
ncbi:allergen Tha p 1-like [Diabrotica undecimpunctata]|uniref:allergen Tha p 1-like n=1 Tax=Diabrotica undecimpunctata TaxID=50387 RepID=UPI003B6382F9